MNRLILSALIDIVFFIASIVLICVVIIMADTNSQCAGICLGIALFLIFWVATGITDLIIKKNNNAKQ